MTDPIADMLTRMRNALAIKRAEVFIPFSKIKFSIAEILKQEGYIDSFTKEENPHEHPRIKIILKYKNNEAVINSLKKTSKSGQRIYVKKDELKSVLSGMGIAILSTSAGLMTNKEAKKRGLGGEVLLEIY